MPDTIVEKVARALCRAEGGAPTMPMNGKSLWQHYVPVARAAIIAMREPSEAMKTAGAEEGGFAGYYGDDPENRTAAQMVWHAMVDMALQEG
ncbi:hypothetical protein [Sphingomonas crocodyli]|uniref:Uncharacterized protein n=1 Tax=Sphingomonas crocodyli TaxID=1979270 RepID=A0A437LXX0_9SPHN|nr:hypothetical protein [Sphingomonas crocodyli]RVT90204.1 hypothetical protein EOD43_18070 [Sphingomonas crocodyli]